MIFITIYSSKRFFPLHHQWLSVRKTFQCDRLRDLVYNAKQLSGGILNGEVNILLSLSFSCPHTNRRSSGAITNYNRCYPGNLATQTESTQKTDSDGRFVFLSLNPGRYTVTASKSGFSKVIQEDLDLTVGQAINLRITLKVSAASETVEVTGTPTIETTQTESSTTLNELAVSETPVLGRKFEDLLTLTPGVAVVQGPDGDEISFSGQ